MDCRTWLRQPRLVLVRVAGGCGCVVHILTDQHRADSSTLDHHSPGWVHNCKCMTLDSVAVLVHFLCPNTEFLHQLTRTRSLIPWSGGILYEKLMVSQLVKIFPDFLWNLKFYYQCSQGHISGSCLETGYTTPHFLTQFHYEHF
jgi:hypothetical protein